MPGTSSPPIFTWKRIWLILILLAAIWLLVSARAALGPVAAAFILAYLLNPVVGILERKKIPRTPAVILILLSLVVLLALLSVSVAPLVEQQILAFSRSVPDYIRVIESWAEKTLSRFDIFPPGQMSDFISQNLAVIASVPLEAIRAGENVLIRTTTGLFSLLVTIAFIALIPVMTFY
ncbi:MAG: AI-2E family transporter, partial [Nitrospinota bacterium]|nr:AI-2E family transporter [Nitrospinota bacterium]